jgi:hypothetical protein
VFLKRASGTRRFPVFEKQKQYRLTMAEKRAHAVHDDPKIATDGSSSYGPKNGAGAGECLLAKESVLLLMPAR